MIGPNVRIGADTWIGPCAVIARNTTIGARTKIFQFASVGEDSQDLKYRGEPSRLEIGDECRIREFASIHRGTEGGGMLTKLGNRVLVMNYAHIAHNCRIGDDVILTNGSQLGGVYRRGARHRGWLECISSAGSHTRSSRRAPRSHRTCRLSQWSRERNAHDWWASTRSDSNGAGSRLK